MVLVSDITKVIEMENYSYKLRSMFFSSVAHELRTPLNSIVPISARLKEITKDPKALKFIEIIVNSSKHLLHVIEDALDMSRIENNKFELNEEDFNIRQVISEVQEIMSFQS